MKMKRIGLMILTAVLCMTAPVLANWREKVDIGNLRVVTLTANPYKGNTAITVESAITFEAAITIAADIDVGGYDITGAGDIATTSLDVNSVAATDYVRMDQTNTTGTSTEPYMEITDARTGTFADTAAEASLVITAAGAYGLAVVDGIVNIEAEIDCTGDMTLDPAGDDLIVDATIDATAITVDAGAGIDVKSAGTLDIGVLTADAVDIGKTTEITTIKGLLNVDEAATFDITVGVTGDLTASGNLLGDDATVVSNIATIATDLIVSDGSALAIGDASETIAITSSDWTISTSGAMAGIGAIGCDSIAVVGAISANGTIAGDDDTVVTGLSNTTWVAASTLTIGTATVVPTSATELTITETTLTHSGTTLGAAAITASGTITANGDITGDNDTIVSGVSNVTLVAGAELTIDGKYAVVGPDASNGYMVQMGGGAGVTNGATITYPTAFSSAPIVILGYNIAGSATNAYPSSVGATTFVVNGTAGIVQNWVAYGIRP